MPYVPTKVRVRNFIRDLWGGNFGLARTYWYYGVVVNLSLSVFVYLLKGLFGDLLFLPFLILSLMYAVISSVGTWRAAGRYDRSKLLAALAKIAVVVVWLYPLIESVLAKL